MKVIEFRAQYQKSNTKKHGRLLALSKIEEEALSTKRDFQDHNSIDESSNTDIWVKIIEADKNEMKNLNKADH